MYYLEFDDGTGRSLIYQLKEGSATVGRNKVNDIVLPDKSVSRSHCMIFYRRGEIEIEDLGSANGVHVEGNLILARTPITLTDDIKIGIYSVKIYTEHPQDSNRSTILISRPPK